MQIQGHVENGVVVLEGGIALPDGTAVTVSYPATVATASKPQLRRVEFPLVRSASPGSVNLSSERIAEILDEEDGSA